MDWQEVCEHPSLHDLPFKIELNERGQILMSPVKFYHSVYQGQIIRLLPKEGSVMAECAIKTDQGTKVADVAWVSEERVKKLRGQDQCPISPEICIEVISESNTEAEITEKKMLYFNAGAIEFWTCNKAGEMSFYNVNTELDASILVSDFPKKLETF